ncbi:MAG: hypothetical protein Q4F43_00800 [Eubacteriales bacterium]|nr:hypothetical protein [Eubacteriales bacterium]
MKRNEVETGNQNRITENESCGIQVGKPEKTAEKCNRNTTKDNTAGRLQPKESGKNPEKIQKEQDAENDK